MYFDNHDKGWNTNWIVWYQKPFIWSTLLRDRDQHRDHAYNPVNVGIDFIPEIIYINISFYTSESDSDVYAYLETSQQIWRIDSMLAIVGPASKTVDRQ